MGSVLQLEGSTCGLLQENLNAVRVAEERLPLKVGVKILNQNTFVAISSSRSQPSMKYTSRYISLVQKQ
jgi:hypothetical protein